MSSNQGSAYVPLFPSIYSEVAGKVEEKLRHDPNRLNQMLKELETPPKKSTPFTPIPFNASGTNSASSTSSSAATATGNKSQSVSASPAGSGNTEYRSGSVYNDGVTKYGVTPC